MVFWRFLGMAPEAVAAFADDDPQTFADYAMALSAIARRSAEA